VAEYNHTALKALRRRWDEILSIGAFNQALNSCRTPDNVRRGDTGRLMAHADIPVMLARLAITGDYPRGKRCFVLTYQPHIPAHPFGERTNCPTLI